MDLNRKQSFYYRMGTTIHYGFGRGDSIKREILGDFDVNIVKMLSWLAL